MMNIFIENTISGLGTCHLELHVTPESTIDSLISAFCIDKGVRHRPQYVLKTDKHIILDNVKTLESCGIQPGEVLYLTTKNEEQQLLGFHNWWLMAGAACFIGLVGLVTVSVLFSMNSGILMSYGIVFDAGSSHTSMTIYKWDSEKLSGTGQVNQIQYCTANGSGISSYVETPDVVKGLFENCLQDAKRCIPEHNDETSQLFFGATAGMRILNLTNPDGAKRLMEVVNETLMNSSFAFNPDHARILTGEEEGIFGWISINYLSKVLGTVPRLDTFGALDMGGASTQISYSTNNSEEHLRLYGYDYNVFSRSYLCFGLNEFERRFYAKLALDAGNETVIQNPCNPRGIDYKVSQSQIFNHLCTVKSTIKDEKDYTFTGNFNQEECDRLIYNHLDYANCTKQYNYCLNKNDLPLTNDSFLAFSGFYFLMDDLNATKLNLSGVKAAVHAFCNKSKLQLFNLPLSSNAPEYLTQLCLRSQYALKLLVDVYQFDEKRWKKLSFVNTINNAEVGWSLGFMTNATNAIPEEDPYVTLSVTAFVILVVLFIAFILVGVLFMYQAWKKKHRSTIYQRFSQYGAI